MTCKEDNLEALVINKYSTAFKNVDREALARMLSFYQNLWSFSCYNWDWSFQLRLGSVSGIKNVKQKIKTRVKNLIQEYGGKIKIWNILE